MPRVNQNYNPTLSIKRLGNNISGTAGALLSGAVDIPIDIARYAHLGLNTLSGMSSGQGYEAGNKRINKQYNNPTVFSDEINNYRNQLKQEYPVSHVVGTVAGGGLGSGALVKSGVNLVRNGAPRWYKNRLPAWLGGNRKYYKRGAVESAGAVGAGLGETVKEPIYDKAYGVNQ